MLEAAGRPGNWIRAYLTKEDIFGFRGGSVQVGVEVLTRGWNQEKRK